VPCTKSWMSLLLPCGFSSITLLGVVHGTIEQMVEKLANSSDRRHGQSPVTLRSSGLRIGRVRQRRAVQSMREKRRSQSYLIRSCQGARGSFRRMTDRNRSHDSYRSMSTEQEQQRSSRCIHSQDEILSFGCPQVPEGQSNNSSGKRRDNNAAAISQYLQHIHRFPACRT